MGGEGEGGGLLRGLELIVFFNSTKSCYYFIF